MADRPLGSPGQTTLTTGTPPLITINHRMEWPIGQWPRTTGTVHNPESGATIPVTVKIHGAAGGNYWSTSWSPCTGSIWGLLHSPNVYYGLSSGYVLV